MSKIYTIESSGTTIRGNRSKLISFYCPLCGVVHEDYPINDLIIYDNVCFCKESVNSLK